MRFSPKSFAQPDLLKSIQPENLLRLLEVQRPFFEDKGFVFPAGGDGRIDYLSLAGILAQRLRGRGKDSEAQVAIRLEHARHEMEQFEAYDYLVVNDDLERTVQEICQILLRHRGEPRP